MYQWACSMLSTSYPTIRHTSSTIRRNMIFVAGSRMSNWVSSGKSYRRRSFTGRITAITLPDVVRAPHPDSSGCDRDAIVRRSLPLSGGSVASEGGEVLARRQVVCRSDDARHPEDERARIRHL